MNTLWVAYCDWKKTLRCVVFLGWMNVLCSVLIVCRIDFVIVGMLAVVSVVGGVVCSYLLSVVWCAVLCCRWCGVQLSRAVFVGIDSGIYFGR
jgi:hypothetical protein